MLNGIAYSHQHYFHHVSLLGIICDLEGGNRKYSVALHLCVFTLVEITNIRSFVSMEYLEKQCITYHALHA